MKKFIIFCLVTASILYLYWPKKYAEKHYQNLLENNSGELYHFLSKMPKGADIHNHLVGSIYAENYIKLALKDDLCIHKKSLYLIPLKKGKCATRKNTVKLKKFIQKNKNYHKIINSFSLRNFSPYNTESAPNSAEQFFNSFAKFDPAIKNNFNVLLSEVILRAAKQNILYLEIMQSVGMSRIRNIARKWEGELNEDNFAEFYLFITKKYKTKFQQIIKESLAYLDREEQKSAKILKCHNNKFANCTPKTRYIAQVIRAFSNKQVFAQAIFANELIKRDKRYLALNFVAAEHDRSTLKNYDLQMKMLRFLKTKYSSYKATLHAGELNLGLVAPEDLEDHIDKAINIAGANRIGHGSDIIYEKNFQKIIKKMQQDSILVEISLSSSEAILDLKGPDHPIRTYLKYGVPLTLSTDDEGVSRINLTHEYLKAAKTYQLSYAQLKMFSRNSLEYFFFTRKKFLATR